MKFFDQNKDVFEFDAYKKLLTMVSRKIRTVAQKDIWANEVFKEMILEFDQVVETD